MGISIAKTTDAEAIAGINDSKFLSPAKLRKALNASGNALTFAARAWISFNGQTATPTIFASGNVSSITDYGVGDFGINFTNAMQDANFASIVNCSVANFEPRIGAATVHNANYVRIETGYSTFINQDDDLTNVVVFR